MLEINIWELQVFGGKDINLNKLSIEDKRGEK